MTTDEARKLLSDQGVHAGPAHLAATASSANAFIEATARHVAALPFEAEPSAYLVEQRSAS